jgi:1-acyl-sn-glycerol-3-phosphate acyltransferase
MSRARAYLRLGVFVYFTLRHVGRALVRMAFSANRRQIPIQEIQNWALSIRKPMGIEVEFGGEIPKENGLILANHRSYMDIVPIPVHLQTTFVAKQEVRRWPIIGYAGVVGQAIYVDRHHPESRKRTRLELKDRLEQGFSMVVYPEGTTSASPDLRPFKPGMFHVAASGSIPIIPVAIEYERPEDAFVGDDTFLPHFLKTFRRKKIRIKAHFGPVIRDTDGERLRQRVSDWMKQELASMQEAFGHLARPHSVLFLCGQEKGESALAEARFNQVARERCLPWRAEARHLPEQEQTGRQATHLPQDIKDLMQARKLQLAHAHSYFYSLKAEDLRHYDVVVGLGKERLEPRLKARFANLWPSLNLCYWSSPTDASDAPSDWLSLLDAQIEALLNRLINQKQ